MTDSDRYGTIAGANDVEPLATDQREDQDYIGDAGSSLWDYLNEGRINGVPVAAEDTGLKIDDDRMIGVVFVLHRQLASELLYLSPDGGPGVDKYNKLMAEMNDGRLEIVDEIRQWDQEHARFVVWIRYNKLEYRLHPRFSYLREE